MADTTTLKDVMGLVTQVNNIGFADFTSMLVSNTYNAVNQGAMQQLRQYAAFVQTVSQSVADFISKTVGAAGSSQETQSVDNYIANNLGLTVPTTGNPPQSDPNGTITLTYNRYNYLVGLFSGLKNAANQDFGAAVAAPANATATTTVTLARLREFALQIVKKNASDAYDLLVTILKLGMQKIVVTNGHILTKLTFHVDAQSSLSDSSTNVNVLEGVGIGGFGDEFMSPNTVGAGVGAYTQVNVNVVNERSASAANLNADIIGEVLIEFKTDSFPPLTI
jgi:hypothetical protein